MTNRFKIIFDEKIYEMLFYRYEKTRHHRQEITSQYELQFQSSFEQKTTFWQRDRNNIHIQKTQKNMLVIPVVN